jgi:O-antigen/teichoic acid export membrane protein
MIGVFLTDEHVGLYTLAAMVAEGLFQCLVVVRNQMNPVIAKLLAGSHPVAIVALAQQAWRYLYPLMGLAYLMGLGGLFVVVSYWLPLSHPGSTLGAYAILAAGVWAVSGFVPFDGVLVQSGRPGHHTFVALLVVVSNAFLNLLLIPNLGLVGAALATGLSLVMSIVYLNVFMRWQLGFSYLSRVRRVGAE